MALFDRRLLAYFDDGLGSVGSATLLDRIADYQRDLSEIERELSKYRVLLGSRQVQFRDRDRTAWITKNREQKTIKERYRRLANTIEGVDSGRDGLAYGEESQSSTGVSSRRKSAGGLGGRRRSTDQSSNAQSSPGIARNVFVQIDSITDLPPPRCDRYFVRCKWPGTSSRGEETSDKALVRTQDGDEKLQIREQVHLKGTSSTSVVNVAVFGRHDGREHFIGDCSIDSADSASSDVQTVQLHDKNKRPVFSGRLDEHDGPKPTSCRLRMMLPGQDAKDVQGGKISPRSAQPPPTSTAPARPHADSASHVSTSGRGESTQRASVTSSRRPSIEKEERRQSVKAKSEEPSPRGKEDPSREASTRSSAAVTQDPAAAATAGSHVLERRKSEDGGAAAKVAAPEPAPPGRKSVEAPAAPAPAPASVPSPASRQAASTPGSGLGTPGSDIKTRSASGDGEEYEYFEEDEEEEAVSRSDESYYEDEYEEEEEENEPDPVVEPEPVKQQQKGKR